MNVPMLFWTFHHNSLKAYGPRIFGRLNEQQMRARPQRAVNSIAWLIWHMARGEGAGMNRLMAV